MADEDDELVAQFLEEARERARFRNPDDDISLPLFGADLPWKTVIALLLLAWLFAP